MQAYSCFSLKEGVVVSALCVPLNLLPRLCKQKLPSPSRRAPLNANTSSRQMPADTTESNGAFLLSYSEQLTSKEGRSTMCSQSDLSWDESYIIPFLVFLSRVGIRKDFVKMCYCIFLLMFPSRGYRFFFEFLLALWLTVEENRVHFIKGAGL